MNTTTQIAATIAPHFIKFEVQRAIRIVTENGEHCRAIDARQDESILAPIMFDEALHDRYLGLMETEIDGKFYALIDKVDGPLYKQAMSCDNLDFSCIFSDGSYGGVVWRVLGYLSDRPDDAMQLQAGNDEAGINLIFAAFQAMKDAASVLSAEPKPVQVVVDISGGAIHGVYAKQPVDIVFMSDDKNDLDDHQIEQGYVSMESKPVALHMNCCANAVYADVVDYYFHEFSKTTGV